MSNIATDIRNFNNHTKALEERANELVSYYGHCGGDWHYFGLTEERDGLKVRFYTGPRHSPHAYFVITPEDIAPALEKIEYYNSPAVKRLNEQRCREWLEAVDVDVDTVTFRHACDHSLQFDYTEKNGNFDSAGIPIEYFSLPATERAGFAQTHDEEYLAEKAS